MNNPLKFVDPDGKKAVIKGPLKDEGLEQLQKKTGKNMQLAMNEDGNLSYTVKEGAKLRGDAKRLANIIDDESITVHLLTTDANRSGAIPEVDIKKDKDLSFTGGAFLGNRFEKDADGNIIMVNAYQLVNPRFLKKVDDYAKTPGKMMFHEFTEAYEGALISREKGVHSPNSNFEKSVFNEAHLRAAPQVVLYNRYYDQYGNEQLGYRGAVKEEIYIIMNQKEILIHTNTNP